MVIPFTQLCLAYESDIKIIKIQIEYEDGYIAYCAQCIEAKANQYGYYFPDGSHNSVFGFIDNTIRESLRPGGGPTHNGDRWDNEIQRSFYNGWKKIHGLKWQTLD